MNVLGIGLIFAMTVSAAVAGGVTAVRADAAPADPIITSWAGIETAPLNAKIRRARAANESWTAAPHLYVFNLFETTGLKNMTYQVSTDRLEQPRRLDIRLVRDGFADDSVRGDVLEITLKSSSSDAWEIVSAKQAWRCWRSGAKTYSSKPCH